MAGTAPKLRGVVERQLGQYRECLARESRNGVNVTPPSFSPKTSDPSDSITITTTLGMSLEHSKKGPRTFATSSLLSNGYSLSGTSLSGKIARYLSTTAGSKSNLCKPMFWLFRLRFND